MLSTSYPCRNTACVWLSGKESICNEGFAGDVGFISELGNSLEEGMATHPSIHARKIPWTEEPGRLWSMESQRVEHTEETEHAL